jgi:extradiol dioxygenase family protein
MRQRPHSFCAFAVRTVVSIVAMAATVWAQPLPPNTKGVSMGHIHLIVQDVPATKQLWSKLLGTAPARIASLDGVSMPGMYVWFQQAAPSAAMDGSTIRDLGLRVRDLHAVLERATQAKLYCRGTSRTSAYVLAPGDVMLELTEDSLMTTDVAADHIHLIVTNLVAARRWYGQRFGNVIPGIRLEFIQSDNPMAPTKGRAVDHIGFEVSNPQAYLDGREVAGTGFEIGQKSLPGLESKPVFLVDPWGTRIELTERPEHNWPQLSYEMH